MSHRRVTFPCLNVKMVPYEAVEANQYNPNHVPKDKMLLLRQSILDNGFCFPIVTIWDDERSKYVIIDGFHRYTILGPQWLNVPEIPIVVLEHDISQRMAATMQFNKARGTHQVDLDAELVRSLLEQGLSEDEVALHLGIDLETVHRYKQLTGILSLFSNSTYSMSWGMEEAEAAHE